MDKKKTKKNIVTIILFVIGLIIYLIGLLLLFSSSISKTNMVDIFFSNFNMTTEILKNMKIIGIIFFIVGFILFMVAVVLLYKNDEISENNLNLIIEGKADVITLIVMTYVMIFMIVICLIYNEMIGALLFGITIVIQSTVNGILIRYFNKNYRKK